MPEENNVVSTDQDDSDAFNEFAKAFDEEDGIDNDEIELLDVDEANEVDDNDIEEPANAQVEQESAFDIETLSPAAKKRFQELESVEHKFKSDEGRVSALQRKLDEQRHQLEQLQQQGNGDSKKAQKLEEDIENKVGDLDLLLEDLPELGALVSELKELRERVNGVSNVVQDQVINPAQTRAAKDAEAAEIDSLTTQHPDFKEIESNPEFWEWVDGQHEAISSLSKSDNARDVAALVSLYKKQNQISQKQKTAPAEKKIQRNGDDLMLLPSDGHSRSSSSSGDDDALWKHFSKQADDNLI